MAQASRVIEQLLADGRRVLWQPVSVGRSRITRIGGMERTRCCPRVASSGFRGSKLAVTHTGIAVSPSCRMRTSAPGGGRTLRFSVSISSINGCASPSLAPLSGACGVAAARA